MDLTHDEVLRHVRDQGPTAGEEWQRLAFFSAYYEGQQAPPYTPATATREFKELTRKCTTNITRLVCNTMTQRLIVDGYRSSATEVENAQPWEWWQENGLDSRQKALYDEAAKHGYAFVMVLPGEEPNTPVMRPVSAREWWAAYDSAVDEWPEYALRKVDNATWQVLDDHNTYTVQDAEASMEIIREERHGLGVVPLVIFRNTFELSRWPSGEIEPVINIQDRLNQTVFDLLVAQTYAAAPQKYIAGLSVPTDDNGRPILDISAFAKSVWVDADKDTKFGSLPEANLSNIVHAIEQCLRMYGLMSQTPPHYMLGDLVNLSAEALLAADTTLAKKVNDRQALFGEAWEQVFRLAGVATGNTSAADDTAAQVWWRDTEPRSVAQQVDALGKMALMLQIPPEALWSKVPGTTGGDLELWRAEAAKARLRAAVDAARQARLNPQPTPPPPGQPGQPPATKPKLAKDQAA